jgi:hypothetical protein
VLRNAGEAHCLENRFKHSLGRRAELDEFKAIEPGRVFE